MGKRLNDSKINIIDLHQNTYELLMNQNLCKLH